VTATELLDQLDYQSVNGVRNRLEDLEQKGFVKHHDVGARATVWYLTTYGREQFRES
jgi:predicted ArsR family transcriptional regulator